MNARLSLVLLAALAGAACDERAQQPPTSTGEKYAVGKYIPFSALIAKDLKGRSFEICEDAQRIMRQRLGAGAAFRDCITDQTQVQPLGDSRYAISSWAEVAGKRIEYSGEAKVAPDDDEPRFVKFTRLDGGGQ